MQWEESNCPRPNDESGRQIGKNRAKSESSRGKYEIRRSKFKFSSSYLCHELWAGSVQGAGFEFHLRGKTIVAENSAQKNRVGRFINNLPTREMRLKLNSAMAGGVNQIEHGIAAEWRRKCPCRSCSHGSCRRDSPRARIQPLHVQRP